MPRAVYRQSAASHQVNSVQIFRVFLHGLFIRIKESCAQGSCSQVGAVWVRKQRLLPHIRKTTAASSYQENNGCFLRDQENDGWFLGSTSSVFYASLIDCWALVSSLLLVYGSFVWMRTNSYAASCYCWSIVYIWNGSCTWYGWTILYLGCPSAQGRSAYGRAGRIMGSATREWTLCTSVSEHFVNVSFCGEEQCNSLVWNTTQSYSCYCSVNLQILTKIRFYHFGVLEKYWPTTIIYFLRYVFSGKRHVTR
jgi:hypothetical protein